MAIGIEQRMVASNGTITSGGASIELRALTKRFGAPGSGILAVDGVSFTVGPGEVVGFLGPNGAGKSTTMKMVTGFLTPTSGTARVCGFDVEREPLRVKERIGYLPEGAPAYPDMTPASFLDFVARVRRLRGSAKRDAIARAVARTNLEGVLRQNVETLSKGFKRRVGLAQAILHEPDVLILDEPTDGLDPNQKHEVRTLIRAMARQTGKAIVLSTHILEEVEAVCSRAIVIAAGRVVVDCTPLELMARSRYHNAVTIALVPPPGTYIFDELRMLPGVEAAVEQLAGKYRIGLICNTGYTGGRVLRQVLAQRGLIGHIEVLTFSNEHGYLKPHHTIFHDTLAALSVSPEHAVHIGDTEEMDIVGAQAAGMYSARYLPAGDNDGAIVSQADIEFSDWTELPGLLEARQRGEA